MAGELNSESLEASLGAAFGDAPASEPEAPDAEILAPEVPESAEPAETEDAPKVEAAPVEPEFEIEVNGVREVVKGADNIKSMLQKAKDYTIKTEAVARERESIAQERAIRQQEAQFHRVIMDDISALKAMDARLEQFGKVDWSTLIDSNFTEAMKLQEERNQLRSSREAKVNEINWKKSQFDGSQAEAAAKLRTSEMQALHAKVPEFRDSTKAAKLTSDILSVANNYGFSEAEIRGVTDHRVLIVLKELADYRALKAVTTSKVKQAREAPPVVKPGVVSNPASQGRQAFKDFHKGIVKAGRQGNHKSQEDAMTAALGRAFKV